MTLSGADRRRIEEGDHLPDSIVVVLLRILSALDLQQELQLGDCARRRGRCSCIKQGFDARQLGFGGMLRRPRVEEPRVAPCRLPAGVEFAGTLEIGFPLALEPPPIEGLDRKSVV